MLTASYIKKRVENHFQCSDIGVRHRKGEVPYYRYVYFQLCRDFTKESFAEIGRLCGKRDHSTVKNGITKFKGEMEANIPYVRKFAIAYEVLRNDFEIRKREIAKKEISTFQTTQDLRRDYRARLIKIIEKNHSIIRKMNFFKKSSILKKLYDLPEDKIIEFEALAEKFLNDRITKK